MGFIERELARITDALQSGSCGERREEFYAVQQALSWALEPGGYRSPFSLLADTQEGLADCLGAAGQKPSADSSVARAA